MFYPIGILVVAIGVIALLLVKVIPSSRRCTKRWADALPAPTQIVVDISEFMQKWVLVILAAMAAIGVRLLLRAQARAGSSAIAPTAFFLKMPVIGSLLRKIVVARFTRTLGTMLSSGVPILDALDICARTAGNLVIETALREDARRDLRGPHMAGPLADVERVPDHGRADDRRR